MCFDLAVIETRRYKHKMYFFILKIITDNNELNLLCSYKTFFKIKFLYIF